jgi:predicted N-acyltransferase
MPPTTIDTPQLTARWDNAIDSVGEAAWQATTQGRSFFLSYPWLRGAERTLTPEPCYLSLWRADGGHPVACIPAQHIAAGASYFYYDLPRMLSDADTVAELVPFLAAEEQTRLTATAELLRERSAQLYPVLLAVANGMAVGLCLRSDLRDRERGAAAETAVAALTTRARSVDAPVAGFLYLARDDDPELAASLAAARFVSGTVAAECVMPVHWDSFDGYVESFSQKRRYAIRREVAAFERSGLHMEVGDATTLGPEIAELQAQLRVKYGHPGDTASILRSYHQMRESLGPYVRVFVARRGHAAVGFVLAFAYGDTYYAKSIGFDYTALGHDFCYFTVLFYEPVRRAIAEGVRLIHYGVDSYDAKIARGCQLRLLDASVKFTGPLGPLLGEAFALHTKATAERFRQLAKKYR